MIRNKAANKFEVLRITFVLCSSLREMKAKPITRDAEMMTSSWTNNRLSVWRKFARSPFNSFEALIHFRCHHPRRGIGNEEPRCHKSMMAALTTTNVRI